MKNTHESPRLFNLLMRADKAPTSTKTAAVYDALEMVRRWLDDVESKYQRNESNPGKSKKR